MPRVEDPNAEQAMEELEDAVEVARRRVVRYDPVWV